MGLFSFTAEIREVRTLHLPAGTLMGRVTVAITPADEAVQTRPQAAGGVITAAEGLTQEQIDSALERERASWR